MVHITTNEEMGKWVSGRYKAIEGRKAALLAQFNAEMARLERAKQEPTEAMMLFLTKGAIDIAPYEEF